MLCTYCSF